ncbi:MAG: hypothetical protein ABWZ38_10070 [Candidatus Binatia bacterium]
MIAFEVFLNGNKVCRAGVGDLGVLTTVLSWVRREGRNTETKEPGNIEEELTLNVSGLLSSKKEHVRWSESKVTIGDEIRVRVVSAESVDPPDDRSTEDPAEDKGRQERYVEQMAKRFGWTIQK